MTINLHAAWIGMFLGALSGALIGMFFYDEGWLGGYNSWRRRMLRLGHISFFGIAFLNICFVLTARALALETGIRLPSTLFLVAQVGMPLVCYLSAIKKDFRHLFFVPAGSVLIGLTVFLAGVLRA